MGKIKLITAVDAKNGFFISFESGEFGGKSTQARLLAERLQKQGYEVKVTREPGGIEFCEKVRNLLLHDKSRRADLSDLFLFEAARATFVQEVVKPILEQGVIVIADRFSDSSTAYQGYASGIDVDLIKRLNEIATAGINPDLTFVIDINAEQALKAAERERVLDNFEKRGTDFHKRVNEGYRQIARDNPKRCVVIPYKEGDIDGMHGEIYRIAMQRISSKSL